MQETYVKIFRGGSSATKTFNLLKSIAVRVLVFRNTVGRQFTCNFNFQNNLIKNSSFSLEKNQEVCYFLQI